MAKVVKKWIGRLHELWAAIFMACLLVVLHHHVPLVDILDKFAFLFVSATSVEGAPVQPRTVVIGIDQKTFEQDFLERSPLDRCVMADKLAAIYKARPALLVVDFDLSPSLAGLAPHAPDRARDLACEATLYALLRDHAAAVRTVMLRPFSVADENARVAKQAWQGAQERNGIVFGDGALPVQFGFVQQHYVRPDTLAAVAGGGVHAAGAHGANQHAAPALRLLNFRAYAREVGSLSWDQWHSSPSAASLAGKNVFLGAAYTSDDRFLTPIDDLYGVNLHAAAFVSLHNQITPAWWAFLVDIFIGVAFGAAVGFAWKRYLRDKLGADQDKRARAAIYLVGLVVGYVLVLGLLMLVAQWLVIAQNIWISPLPMALGMTLDAFIIGAINAPDDLDGESGHGGTRAAPHSPTITIIGRAKIALWSLVVGYALLLMAFSNH